MKQGWVALLDQELWDQKGQILYWPKDVVLAVWDENKILSEYNTYGDLKLVGIDKTCLPPGHATFQEGPLNPSCVVYLTN